MYQEIKIAVEITEQGNTLIGEAVSGKDWSDLSDKEQKARTSEELSAYSEIEKDFEDLVFAIEELVDDFSSNLVTVSMTD